MLTNGARLPNAGGGGGGGKGGKRGKTSDGDQVGLPGLVKHSLKGNPSKPLFLIFSLLATHEKRTPQDAKRMLSHAKMQQNIAHISTAPMDLIEVEPAGTFLLFKTACKRGLRVNSIQNDPLASFMWQNR